MSDSVEVSPSKKRICQGNSALRPLNSLSFCFSWAVKTIESLEVQETIPDHFPPTHARVEWRGLKIGGGNLIQKGCILYVQMSVDLSGNLWRWSEFQSEFQSRTPARTCLYFVFFSCLSRMLWFCIMVDAMLGSCKYCQLRLVSV